MKNYIIIFAFFYSNIAAAIPGTITKYNDLDTGLIGGSLYLAGNPTKQEDRLVVIWPSNSTKTNATIKIYEIEDHYPSFKKPILVSQINLIDGSTINNPVLSPNEDKFFWVEVNNRRWLNVYDVNQKKLIYREILRQSHSESISWSQPNGKHIIIQDTHSVESSLTIIEPVSKDLAQIDNVQKWESLNRQDAIAWLHDGFYFIKMEPSPGKPKVIFSNLYRWTQMDQYPELVSKLGVNTPKLKYFHLEPSFLYLYTTQSVYKLRTDFDTVVDISKFPAIDSSAKIRVTSGLVYPIVQFDSTSFESLDLFGTPHGPTVSIGPITDFWFESRGSIIGYYINKFGADNHLAILWQVGEHSFKSEAINGKLLNRGDHKLDKIETVQRLSSSQFRFDTLIGNSFYFTRFQYDIILPANKFLMDYERLQATSYGWGFCFSDIDEKYHSSCQPGIQVRGAAKINPIAVFPITINKRSNLQWLAYSGNPLFVSLDEAGILSTWTVSEY